MLLHCLLSVIFAFGQDSSNRTYDFGRFAVKTGDCKRNTQIEVFDGGRRIYHDCSGDGYGYLQVDSLYLNSDALPDFVFAYAMEEYTVIGLLVSSESEPKYRKVDIGILFDPQTYDSVLLDKNETIRQFVLKDANNDGRKDLITNLLLRNGAICAIKNWTDTTNYNDLRQKAKGRTGGLKTFGKR